MHKIVQVGGKRILRGSGTVGTVDASENEITDLDCPDLVTTDTFSINDNKGLTTLKGGPLRANDYAANNCGLTELGCPDLVVDKTFSVSDNQGLTSLKGGPRSVQIYYARFCGLTALECEELECQVMRLTGNKGLTSLAGGPKGARIYHVNKCGLTSIASDTKYAKLLAEGNPNIQSLRGCCRGSEITVDAGVPLMHAVGRAKLTYRHQESSWTVASTTVFRAKHELVCGPNKGGARFTR